MSLNSLNRNMLRLTGMASGMDTESMVTSMLKIDQMKVDKQFKVKTQLEWKGEAYRDFNLKLRNFREKYMSVLNPSGNVFSASAYNSFKVSMINESNAFSVTAGSNAMPGSVTVNEISQLASSAKLTSSNMWNTGTSEVISLDTKLSDAASKFATPLQFATRTIQVPDTSEGAPDGAMVDVEEKYISFSINGETFEFTENATLNDIVSKVNSNAAAGVNMSYSSISKGFTLTSRATGAESKIEIANIAGNGFAAGNAAFGIEEQTKNGQNAKLKINGYDVERNSNSFSIDGMQFTLKTELAANSDIAFNVERDIEPTLNKIKDFINGYNELISELQTAYNQRPNRSYLPLTESERDVMTEKESEKWEGFAHEGLLYKDSNIGNLLTTMRSAFYDSVEGVNRSAANIGLRTGVYSDGGKITIDEDALRAALESNPEQIKDMFTKTSASTDTAAKYKESGLVVRISDAMNSYVRTVSNVSLANNQRAIDEASNRLEQLETWIQGREDRYWRQFTAMETAMSNLNSQSSWLTSMLGSQSSK